MTSEQFSAITLIGLENMNDQNTDCDLNLEQQTWTKPELIRYGSVADITLGISYTPNDGISNLTP